MRAFPAGIYVIINKHRRIHLLLQILHRVQSRFGLERSPGDSTLIHSIVTQTLSVKTKANYGAKSLHFYFHRFSYPDNLIPEYRNSFWVFILIDYGGRQPCLNVFFIKQSWPTDVVKWGKMEQN